MDPTKSVAVGFDEKYTNRELYDKVKNGIAKNVKMGPFKATSGVMLPYYLNASTNMMDKNIAPLIIELFIDYLERLIKPLIKDSNVLCVGMEVAGGMLVSQLASANSKRLNSWMDFCYIRKSKKTTGTCQQLEGPNEFTKRTPQSPELSAIWIDDALSTGSSMLEGIKMLKRDYNIQVVAALYLVDRSVDRKNLEEKYQYLSDPTFEKVIVKAIYDLDEIDAIIPKNIK